MEIIKSIGKALLSALLTEKFIKEIIVYLLEKLAKKTSNDVDDEIVAKIKEALNLDKQEHLTVHQIKEEDKDKHDL